MCYSRHRSQCVVRVAYILNGRLVGACARKPLRGIEYTVRSPRGERKRPRCARPFATSSLASIARQDVLPLGVLEHCYMPCGWAQAILAALGPHAFVVDRFAYSIKYFTRANTVTPLCQARLACCEPRRREHGGPCVIQCVLDLYIVK